MSRQPQRRSEGRATAPSRDELLRQLELVGSVRRIMHAFGVRSRQMGSASRITLPQLLCLMAVVAEEGMTSRQIARRIHVSPSTLVGVLDRLEENRWVRRRRDSADRRQIHIEPTAAGRRLVAGAPSPLGERFESALARLSERRQRRLVDNVALMADLMTEQSEPEESA